MRSALSSALVAPMSRQAVHPTTDTSSRKGMLRRTLPRSNSKSWSMRKRRRHAHYRFSRKHLLKLQLMLFCMVALYTLMPSGSTLWGASDDFESDFHSTWGRFLTEDSNTTSSCSSSSSTTSNSTETSGGEFPDDFLSYEQKAHGGIIVHIFLIFYMFMGLAIVCDEYFEPSLEILCEDLHLKEDVAGATFMAAGGSAPELFSSIIGVFVAKSDIGFGTIVGSATFNVLFVIAACAFVTDNLSLSWWPLTRDCVYYCVSIVVLVSCIIDQAVTAVDATILLIMYAIYITIMYFNERLEIYVTKKVEDAQIPRQGWRLKLEHALDSRFFNYFIYIIIVLNITTIFYEMANDETKATNIINSVCSALFITEMVVKIATFSFFGYWQNPGNAFDGTLVILILVEVILSSSSFSGGLRVLRAFRFFRVARVFRLYMASLVEKIDAETQTCSEDWAMLELAEKMTFEEASQYALPFATRSAAAVAPHHRLSLRGSSLTEELKAEGIIKDAEPTEDNDKDVRASKVSFDDDDDDDDGPSNPFELPDGGPVDFVLWLIAFPLSFFMFLTIPDCRRPIFKRFYMLTFFMCIVWIALLAYVMVWMATIFGDFYGIPEPIMGLTLLAAGTSIPDLLSSIAVAKRGFGDMAVSSSIGSNIFDILIGLPVPWFIYTVFVERGGSVEIQSEGITIMVLTLFLMVAAVVSIIHWSNWVMTKKLGVAMVVLYFLFVAESLILEILKDC